jgi:hypothetical protein
MTSKQIQKKLLAAGIDPAKDIEISRGEVTICVGYFERNGYGQCNDRKTTTLTNKVSKALGGWSGYSTGYGARVLQENYVSMGDWSDPTSRHHY